MIEVKNVSYKYKNQKNVFDDINLMIEEGEIVSIIGKNGEGKTTLARIITGLLKPTKGEVIIDGLNAYEKKNFKEIRRKISIVFQNPENQILFNEVYEDVKFALNNLELEDKDRRIDDSLKKVGMEKFKKSDTFKLSLGQKQRINIASAIAIDSKYIVLDEPTTMIDSEGKEKIYSIIKNLKKENKTIIFITNNINEILLSDRIIVIENNKIKKDFRKAQLLENKELLKEVNIKLPDILELKEILKERGVEIKLEEYTILELADKICEVLKNEKYS